MDTVKAEVFKQDIIHASKGFVNPSDVYMNQSTFNAVKPYFDGLPGHQKK